MKLTITPKIKRFFLDDIGLKILAVVLSVLLWLTVVNVDDPTQTKTFTTTVDVINAEVLTDAGRYYEIVDGNNTVSFRVTAKRSVMERLSGTDFTATADMRYLEDDCRVPVTITVNNGNNNISVSAKRLYLQVKVGNEMEISHNIEIETVGDVAENCVVDSVTADPSTVSVSGPEDVVNAIARVVVYVDVKDANEDFTTKSALHFLNADGNELDQSRIQATYDSAQVSVKIVNTKQVPVTVKTTGSLADGLYLESVSVDPQTVRISGDRDVLNEITEIEISGAAVDLSKITATMTTTVDLNTYLPEGVKVADSNDAQATIKINLSGEETKRFHVSTANLTIRNLADGKTVSFDSMTVDVKISGNANQLASLSAATITGYIDVSGLDTGRHTVPVNLELEDGLSAASVTAVITIM